MQTSVSSYEGFYIARYEAGDGSATSKRAGSTGTTNPVVSKKGAFVYNYVTKSQAEQIAKNMYSKGTDGVTSRLISSYAWDTTLAWLEKKGYSMTDSRSWGNYSNATGSATENSGSSNMDYTTGRSEAWKACNIYDLAGMFTSGQRKNIAIIIFIMYIVQDRIQQWNFLCSSLS